MSEASIDVSDADLLRKVGAGDHAAFEMLVRRHHRALHAVVRSVLEASDVQDGLQRGLMAIFRGAHTWRQDARPKTWMLTVARNAAFRIRKTEARHEEKERALLELGIAGGWGSDDPERMAVVAQRKQALLAALGQLSAQDQEILALRDAEEMTGPEVSAILGLSLAAMKSRLHRARLRLASRLRQLDSDLKQGESP